MDTGELRRGSPALIAEILDAVIKRLRDPAVLTKIGASKSEVMKAFGQFCREGIVLRCILRLSPGKFVDYLVVCLATIGRGARH